MGKCEVCGIEVDDKYKYCMKCMNSAKQGNSTQEIADKLNQINWNLGCLVQIKEIELGILDKSKYVRKHKVSKD